MTIFHVEKITVSYNSNIVNWLNLFVDMHNKEIVGNRVGK